MGEDREMTYGEKAVGLKFNHAEGEVHDEVNETKVAFAKLIDSVEGKRQPNDSRFKNALLTGAIQQLVNAQMIVVKVITWKDL